MKVGKFTIRAKRTHGSKDASGGAGLYVYTFPSQRGKKLKIGSSNSDVEHRVSTQAKQTSVPERVELELLLFIRDAHRLEKEIHSALRSKRATDTSGSKEWFHISDINELFNLAPALAQACKVADQFKHSYAEVKRKIAAEQRAHEDQENALAKRVYRVSELIFTRCQIWKKFYFGIDGKRRLNRSAIFWENFCMGFIVLYFSIHLLIAAGIEFLFFGTYFAVAFFCVSVLFGFTIYPLWHTISTRQFDIEKTEQRIIEHLRSEGFDEFEMAVAFVKANIDLAPLKDNRGIVEGHPCRDLSVIVRRNIEEANRYRKEATNSKLGL